MGSVIQVDPNLLRCRSVNVLGIFALHGLLWYESVFVLKGKLCYLSRKRMPELACILRLLRIAGSPCKELPGTLASQRRSSNRM